MSATVRGYEYRCHSFIPRDCGYLGHSDGDFLVLAHSIAAHPNPISPHSCARHRKPAGARLRGEKSPLSSRTWADWISVTSTEMRGRRRGGTGHGALLKQEPFRWRVGIPAITLPAISFRPCWIPSSSMTCSARHDRNLSACGSQHEASDHHRCRKIRRRQRRHR